MISGDVKKQNQQYVLQTYGRFDLALEKGSGATCYDFDGKKYIDMSSGIGVNSLGFCDPDWQKAISEQAAKLQHTSNLFYTQPGNEVARILCKRTGMKKVFFSNSGAESNECAIKAARKYSFMKYGENRNKIVTLENSFHGRTITTISATGQEVFHNYFFPFTEGFEYAKANDIGDLSAKVDSETCAIMIELIQGEGGILPLEQKFVDEVVKLCREKDLILIVDEVQTGIGRTGALFAFQKFGIAPDIVTCAKGIGGGLPLGAVLFSEKTENALGFGDHATTFGMNPVCCAGALVVLNKLNDKMLDEVDKKGAYIREKLLKMPKVTDVSGMGLMIGASLDGAESKKVVEKGIENGVITLTAKARLRLLPPLTITYEEIDEGLCAIEKTLASI